MKRVGEHRERLDEDERGWRGDEEESLVTARGDAVIGGDEDGRRERRRPRRRLGGDAARR